QANAADENASFLTGSAATVRTDGTTITSSPVYAAVTGTDPIYIASESGISSFTTNWGITSLTPTISTSVSSLSFGNVITGTNSSEQQYNVSGSNLVADISLSVSSPFAISTTSGSGFGTSLT